MKTFLRKRQVAARYGVGVRTVERMRDDGRLPEPDFYSGRFPLWSDQLLEAHERAAIRQPFSKQNVAEESDSASALDLK